jgi:glycosyltransferase involved in cell wall biosynthesis
MPSERRVAVVLPCLNEADTIARVVTGFREALPGVPVWVFDNGSTDATANVAAAAGARVMSSPRPGKGAVMRHALWALDADVVLFADGDGTYPADRAAAVLAPVLAGADMAIGDRSSTLDNGALRGVRYVGNDLLIRLMGLVWELPGVDLLSGYRAVDVRFARNLDLRRDGFEIETELTWKALRAGGRVVSVPVAYGERPAGAPSKLRAGRDGARILAELARQMLR